MAKWRNLFYILCLNRKCQAMQRPSIHTLTKKLGRWTTAFMPGQKWPKTPLCRTVNLAGAMFKEELVAPAAGLHPQFAAVSDGLFIDV